MPKKWKVKLRSDQRKKLLRIVHAGKHKSREILYAHILLKAAKGWTDAHIADAFVTSTKTVQRTCQRFVEAGLQAALTEELRPGQPSKLTCRDHFERIDATVFRSTDWRRVDVGHGNLGLGVSSQCRA